MITVQKEKAEKWVGGEIPEDLLGSFQASALEAARRNGLPEDLADDWSQEMAIAVGLRLDSHQEGLSGRRTYMVRLAKWRLQELIREKLRYPLGSINRPMGSVCFSEDENGEREDGSSALEVLEGGVRDDRDALTLRLDMEMVAERLPERLRRTYDLLKTYSPRETASMLGKSVDTVYDHTARIRRAFAHAGIFPANTRPSERKAAV